MSETKVVVPEGMLKTVYEHIRAMGGDALANDIRLDLEAALRWLSENPIVPSKEQVEAIWNSLPDATTAYPYWDKVGRVFGELQRRMFRAAEREVPEAVDPIEFLFEELLDLTETLLPHETDKLGHIRQELEAYRRGQRDKPDVP